MLNAERVENKCRENSEKIQREYRKATGKFKQGVVGSLLLMCPRRSGLNMSSTNKKLKTFYAPSHVPKSSVLVIKNDDFHHGS